jgi:hypothetical protein
MVLDAYEDAIVRGRARATSGDFGADLIERSRYGL